MYQNEVFTCPTARASFQADFIVITIILCIIIKLLPVCDNAMHDYKLIIIIFTKYVHLA